MKRLFLFPFVLLMLGCDDQPIDRKQEQDPLTTVVPLRGGGFITYKIVEIDGVKYFASRTAQGNYVIGPRKD